MSVQRHNLRGLIPLAAVTAALGLFAAASQGGTFPGSNGEIALTCGTSICTINPDGTGKQTLKSSATDPSWSGDGTEIAYNDGTGISVAEDDGSFPTSLSEATATQPSFSFDGDSVAFIKGGDLYTVNSDGTGGEVRITNTVGTDADPAYSPDGSKIAFASNVNGNYDIWIVNSAGGVPFEVTSAAGNERSPSWSPAGSRLVYASAGELFTVPAVAASRRPTSTCPVRSRVLARRLEDRLHHGRRQPRCCQLERHQFADDRRERQRRAARLAAGGGAPRHRAA